MELAFKHPLLESKLTPPKAAAFTYQRRAYQRLGVTIPIEPWTLVAH